MAFTIENNQPSAGCIRWKNLNMSYKGTNYAISDGYTNAIYTYWLASNPNTLVVSNTFPELGFDDCLLFLNKAGTAVVVPGATIIPGDLLVPGSIVGNAIAANTITGGNIAAGTITASNIATGSITANLIAANAIGATAIAANTITGDKLVADAITAREIASATITANELAVGCVTANQIAANAIGANAIAAGVISATHIAANTITVNKLASDVGTSLDLSSNTSINAKVNAIKIAGKNLLLNSGVAISGTSYLIKEYFMSEDFITGETYTVILKGTKQATQTFGLWQNGGSTGKGNLTQVTGTNLYTLTFVASATTAGNERKIAIYNPPSSSSAWTLDWIAMYKGDVKPPMDWVEAPEDLDISTPPIFTANKSLTFSDVIKGTFASNTFTRDTGSGWDAGFRSVETFTNGEYAEHKVVSTGTSYMIGFNNGTNDANYTSIDFAIYKSGASLLVYENGASKGTVGTCAVNDLLRISIENNKVLVYKNDELLYISSITPTLPVYLDASVTSASAAISTIVAGKVSPGSPRYFSDQAARNAAWANKYAADANGSISQIFSDSYLTPDEKYILKKEWDGIVSEKTMNDAQADLFNIIEEKAAYGTAYDTLNAYITPLLATLTSSSSVVGTTMRSNFKDYYDARINLLNAISLKAKSIADQAQANLDDAIVNLTTSINQSADTIQLTVDQKIADTEGNLRQEIQSSIQSTVNDVNISFTNVQTQLNNNTEKVTEIKNYFNFGSDGKMTIGKSNSPFQLTLSNEAMQFISTDGSGSSFTPDPNAVAWVSKDKMLIDKAEILSSLEIGAHVMEKYSGNSKVTIIRYVG